jgi:hypothetical protein
MESNHMPSTRADEIVPFWNRLREISLYPAHPAALTTIGVLALCHLVTDLPFGFVLDILVWVALYKYAFECLRATADGRMEPPEIAIAIEDSLGWDQIKLQAAFLLLNIGGFIFLGPVGGSMVSIVLALSLPGAIMSLAMDQNLGHALNPATWVAIFARLGWPYLAVAGLYFVLNVSQRYAQALVVPILPAVLAEIVFYFITHYVVVATFHLMGYLIYQYHEDVGYEPAPPPQPLSRTLADPDQSLLDEAAQRVRDGQPEVAADVLGQAIKGRGGSELVHTQYRKLLALLGRRDEQLRHGREWISILLAQDKDKRAVDVARECTDLDPGFEPSNPDDVARIAQKAVDMGATQVALKLVSAYIKTHPKHRDVPRNALIAAKVLAERMGKDDVAKKLLDQVAERFPNDALAPDIAAYRAFLDKVGAPKPPG